MALWGLFFKAAVTLQQSQSASTTQPLNIIHEVLYVTGDETRNMQEGTLWDTLYG